MTAETGDLPPARVAAGLVVLRRVRASDAGAIAAAVGVSLGQLRRWMPWATAEAAGRAGQLAWAGAADQMLESGTGYLYAVLTAAHGTLVGEASLRQWAGDSAELGYWIAATQSGRGFATSAARAMTSVALALPDVNRVEIRCDEANDTDVGSGRPTTRLPRGCPRGGPPAEANGGSQGLEQVVGGCISDVISARLIRASRPQQP